MSKTRENEPAFPASAEQCNEYDAHPGMELRDWFAGQALAGITANPYFFGYTHQGSPESAAEFADAVADAMLKAREET